MRTAVSERSCARARRALSLVLDHEAAASDVRTAAMHLGRCRRCRRYAVEVSAFTRQLRSAPAERHMHSRHQPETESGHA
jgi:predicted anti-sigma-YlaC factor YlaD